MWELASLPADRRATAAPSYRATAASQDLCTLPLADQVNERVGECPLTQSSTSFGSYYNHDNFEEEATLTTTIFEDIATLTTALIKVATLTMTMMTKPEET